MMVEVENLENVTPNNFHALNWANPKHYAVPSRASRSNITPSMAAQGYNKMLKRFSFLYDTLAEHEDLLNAQWNVQTLDNLILFVETVIQIGYEHLVDVWDNYLRSPSTSQHPEIVQLVGTAARTILWRNEALKARLWETGSSSSASSRVPPQQSRGDIVINPPSFKEVDVDTLLGAPTPADVQPLAAHEDE